MSHFYRFNQLRYALIFLAALSFFSCTKDDDMMGINRPPLLNFSTTAIAEAEKPFSFAIDADDADGDMLTITVSNLPDWLEFDDTQDVLTGTPARTDEGTVTIGIEVSDGKDVREKELTITVIVPLSFAERVQMKIDALYNQHVPDLLGVSIAVSAPGFGEVFTTRGKANPFSNVMATTEHQYRVASVSKTFTAVLIIRMVEEGRLALDDKLSQYLNLDGLEGSETITIRQMLNHTSGLPDHLNEDDFWDESGNWRSRTWTNEDILGYAKDKGLQFTPGTNYAYSNTGFYLLGAVAETVLEQPLSEIFDEWIIEPLQLEHTFYDDFSNRQNKLDGLAENERAYEYHLSSVAAAGAMVSTPTDVIKFGRAVYEGGFVTAAHAQEMRTDRTSVLGGDKYGLGTRLWDDNGVHHIGHTGALMDYRSILMYVPEYGVTISLTTNDTHANWFDLVNGLLVEVVNFYR